MKCLCILGVLASLATAQAATVLSTKTKDDPSTLTSGGYGAYYGFSFDLDHMLLSSGEGISPNSTVFLQSLDIAKATNRTDATDGLYVTIFSSAATKDGTTFVGQSTTTVDMAGDGAGDGAASWEKAVFNNLQLDSGVTYYVAFTTTQISDATSWGDVSFSSARLRLGKEADGVDIGDVYKNAGFTSTEGSVWGPALRAEVTLAAVPEPASASLGLLGLAALLMRRRRF